MAIVPVPLTFVHLPPEAPVTVPERVATVATVPQTTWLGPAFTVGAGAMVIVTLALTGEQVPFPVVVTVRLAVPEVISAREGV